MRKVVAGMMRTGREVSTLRVGVVPERAGQEAPGVLEPTKLP